MSTPDFTDGNVPAAEPEGAMDGTLDEPAGGDVHSEVSHTGNADLNGIVTTPEGAMGGSVG